MSAIGPSQPSTSSAAHEVSSDDDYGPALPAHLQKARSDAPSKPSIGPTLPPHLQNRAASPSDSDSDSDEAEAGPLPLPANAAASGTDGVAAFREREARLKAKEEELERLKSAKPKRAEWMLVPRSSYSISRCCIEAEIMRV